MQCKAIASEVCCRSAKVEMLNFHREDTGVPLVLIHGVPHHWKGWLPIISPLARGLDVIAADSPGFGDSADLPAGEPHTIQRYADAFEEFSAELSLDRPHVAGNLMGGGIALELARCGSVRTATAISPVGFWTGLERRWVRLVIGANANVPRPARPPVRAAVRTTVGRSARSASSSPTRSACPLTWPSAPSRMPGVTRDERDPRRLRLLPLRGWGRNGPMPW